jgi:hypothetical protein
VLVPPPGSETPRDQASATILPEPATAPGPTLELGAAGVADAFTIPAPQFGAAVFIALQGDHWSGELSGAGLFSRNVTLRGAPDRVRFGLWYGTARACYAVPLGALEGLGCAGAQLGMLRAAEQSPAGREPQEPWLAAELGGGPRLALAPGVSASFRVLAVAPLLRHQLRLTDGQTVHELPVASVQMQLALSFAVTEFGRARH